MRIAIFGATGLVGTATLEEALAKGHRVTILARNPNKVKIRSGNLIIIKGDALDPKAVSEVVAGQDAIIQTLGYGGKGDGKPTTFTTDATRIIIKAMKETNVSRLIAISVLGAGNSISFLPRIFTKFLVPVFMKWFVYIIDDKNNMESLIMNSGLDWTIVRGTTIKNKPAKEKINITFDGKGMTLSISVRDTAAFLVKQVTDKTFLRQAPLISN